MDETDLKIVAKQNNHEVYLLSYTHDESVGFVGDLEKGVCHADDKVQTIRKKGFWIDMHCSENVAKRILGKVLKLKASNQ